MENEKFHTIEFAEKGLIRYVPRELAYCTPSEFKDVVTLIYAWHTDVISYIEFRVQALYKLLKLKKGKRKINNLELEAMHSNIAEISHIIDSFFDIDGNSYQIKLNLTDNPVPYIRPVFVKIKGPEPRFGDTVFGQYEDAVHVFQMHEKSKKVNLLYRLMAIYYQEPKKYNTYKTEAKASFFQKTLDFAQVYGFYLYFKSFQTYVTSSKVMWEGEIIDLSILFSSTSNGAKSNIPGLGTKAIAFLLAESNVFGSLQELRKEQLWEVLLRLYDIRKRDLDNEAEEKRLKTKTNG
jgi:hypothetical protein